jgi:SAM-dependent methyltransferase
MRVMEELLKKILPRSVWLLLKKITFNYKKILYKYISRPVRQGETHKARERRIREKFFEKFCKGRGLDVGYGGDLLSENCQGWDIEHGDAQTLKGLKDSEFDFVYSSHTLEHVDDAEITLRNWWRVIKPGGYLILYLPHRDLYEKKKTLPSRWNETHMRFFLLDRDDAPDSIGVIPLVQRALRGYEIVQAKVCDEGYESKSPETHSGGEYSIEVVIRKS